MSMKDSDFEHLLRCCYEISSLFPESVVYIGGIAVYLHTINIEEIASLAEFTHDADFYISIADMSDLRDIEEVTPNRRLSKHQLIKGGFEFDIYTERYSSLIIPYDQVKAYSKSYDVISVACLEHLFVLKLEAYRDRIKSSKGAKDAKDILRISQITSASKKKLRPELIEGYLSDIHIDLLKQIEKGPEPMSLAKGNSQLAKNIRKVFFQQFEFLLK